MYSNMVKIIIDNLSGNWERIKKSKATITDEEAEETIKNTKEFRKNFEFKY